MSRHAVVLGAFVFGTALASCREPTQITLELTTHPACTDLHTTGVSVGMLGEEVEGRAPSATAQGCIVDNRIGSIVAIPSSADDGEVGFRVVSSIGEPLESCVPPDYGPDCIVARRALRYIPHKPLLLPIVMRESCRGVICPLDETCVDGECRSAYVAGESCTPPEGCGEELLPEGRGGGGGGTGGEGGGPPDEPWVITLGGPAASDQYARAVAVDAAGNVFVTGGFYDAIDIATDHHDAAGSADVFVASFTSEGSLRWSRRVGGNGMDDSQEIAVDGEGDVYVAGSFQGIVDFGTGEVVASQTDIFLARYDGALGTLRWAKSFGGGEADFAQGVAVVGDGVHLVGQIATDVNFGGGVVAGDAAGNGFVAVFDRAGDHVRSKSFGGSTADIALGVGADAQGRSRVAATFTGSSVTIDGSQISAGAGQHGLAVAFDAAGNYDWSLTFSGGGGVLANAVVSGAQGDAYFSVLTGTTMSLVGLADTGPPALWTRSFTAESVANGVAFDGAGNVTYGGEVAEDVDLGSGTLSIADTEAFVLTLDPTDGSYRWHQLIGGPGYQGTKGVAVHSSGAFYAAGANDGSFTIDGMTYDTTGMQDAFLVKLLP